MSSDLSDYSALGIILDSVSWCVQVLLQDYDNSSCMVHEVLIGYLFSFKSSLPPYSPSGAWDRYVVIINLNRNITSRKHFQSTWRNASHVHQKEFCNIQFSYIKDSDTRDLSEGFDEIIVLIIGDAGTSGLNPTRIPILPLPDHLLRSSQTFLMSSQALSFESSSSMISLAFLQPSTLSAVRRGSPECLSM